MGLLDKLWDDVLAGPQPDKGLKKLRKERLGEKGLSDVFQDDSDIETAKRLMDRRRSAEFQHDQVEARRVTQSIAIRKPAMLRPLDTDSPVQSPGSYGSSPLLLPLWHRQAFSRTRIEDGVVSSTQITTENCRKAAEANLSMCHLLLLPFMTGL